MQEALRAPIEVGTLYVRCGMTARPLLTPSKGHGALLVALDDCLYICEIAGWTDDRVASELADKDVRSKLSKIAKTILHISAIRSIEVSDSTRSIVFRHNRFRLLGYYLPETIEASFETTAARNRAFQALRLALREDLIPRSRFSVLALDLSRMMVSLCVTCVATWFFSAVAAGGIRVSPWGIEEAVVWCAKVLRPTGVIVVGMSIGTIVFFRWIVRLRHIAHRSTLARPFLSAWPLTMWLRKARKSCTSNVLRDMGSTEGMHEEMRECSHLAGQATSRMRQNQKTRAGSEQPDESRVIGMTKYGLPIVDIEDLPGRVPSVPLHLCPNCGYDLRGLTRRTCPECGERFTLTGARRKGAGQNSKHETPARKYECAKALIELSCASFLSIIGL